MKKQPFIHTFSIVACDLTSRSWGVAVASKFLAVGAVVPFAKAETGAIATQSLANYSYGPRGLELLAQGKTADETLALLLAEDEQHEDRQVGIVDSIGNAATFTGKRCSAWAGGIAKPGFAIQGNILVSEATVQSMYEAFTNTSGSLETRLYAALAAGDSAGGDSRGKQSAAMLVTREGAGYGGFTDKFLDLRVDDHPHPIAELGKLLQLHQIFLGSTAPEQKIAIEAPLAREFQTLLLRLGYYQGAVSGDWDDATQLAFTQFIGRENLEDRVDIPGRFIDPPALEYIRERFAEK